MIEAESARAHHTINARGTLSIGRPGHHRVGATGAGPRGCLRGYVRRRDGGDAGAGDSSRRGRGGVPSRARPFTHNAFNYLKPGAFQAHGVNRWVNRSIHRGGRLFTHNAFSQSTRGLTEGNTCFSSVVNGSKTDELKAARRPIVRPSDRPTVHPTGYGPPPPSPPFHSSPVSSLSPPMPRPSLTVNTTTWCTSVA